MKSAAVSFFLFIAFNAWALGKWNSFFPSVMHQDVCICCPFISRAVQKWDVLRTAASTFMKFVMTYVTQFFWSAKLLGNKICKMYRELAACFIVNLCKTAVDPPLCMSSASLRILICNNHKFDWCGSLSPESTNNFYFEVQQAFMICFHKKCILTFWICVTLFLCSFPDILESRRGWQRKKKARSDSCMESTGSRLDFQREDREEKKHAFFSCVYLCASVRMRVCVHVIDNGGHTEILHKHRSKSWNVSLLHCN